MNDKRLETTQLSPFFINYGKHPNTLLDPRTGLEAEKALVLSDEIRGLLRGSYFGHVGVT